MLKLSSATGPGHSGIHVAESVIERLARLCSTGAPFSSATVERPAGPLLYI